MDEENKDLNLIKNFLAFIVFVIFILILKELKSIFIPFSMALLLYFLFNGVVKKMVRIKIPKFFILSFLLIFIFSTFYFLGFLIFAGTSSFISKFPAYSDKIIAYLTSLFEQLRIPLSEVSNYVENIDWSQSFNTITSLVSSTFGDFINFVGNLVLVIIFLMFMLAGRNALVGRVNKAFTNKKADQMITIVNSIENQVQHYLLIKTFVSLITAVISGLILFAGNMDFILFSSLLIFVFNFIPNIGSIIATAFPIIIALIKFGFSLKTILIALGLMVTQMIVGNVFEPKITGKNLNLSPIVILLSLIIWGWLWGIMGMILAVPLTVAFKIIFEHIEPLKPLAELISAD